MKLVLFGNKSTTKLLLEHLIQKNYKPHTLVTLDSNLLKKSNIAGAEDSLIDFALENKINVFKPNSYGLSNKKDLDWSGLDFSDEMWDQLMTIDKDKLRMQTLRHEELFLQISEFLPKEMLFERELLVSRL